MVLGIIQLVGGTVQLLDSDAQQATLAFGIVTVYDNLIRAVHQRTLVNNRVLDGLQVR
jgi:hypothetical protein